MTNKANTQLTVANSRAFLFIYWNSHQFSGFSETHDGPTDGQSLRKLFLTYHAAKVAIEEKTFCRLKSPYL